MTINCDFEGQSWQVHIRVLSIHDELYDLMISGRGHSFHAIVGTHAYGGFLCIPNFGIGCELAYFSDTFWNHESISRYLHPLEAATLVAAIKHLPHLQG